MRLDLWCELISHLSKKKKSSFQELVDDLTQILKIFCFALLNHLIVYQKLDENVDLQYIRSGWNSSVKNGASTE